MFIENNQRIGEEYRELLQQFGQQINEAQTFRSDRVQLQKQLKERTGKVQSEDYFNIVQVTF